MRLRTKVLIAAVAIASGLAAFWHAPKESPSRHSAPRPTPSEPVKPPRSNSPRAVPPKDEPSTMGPGGAVLTAAPSFVGKVRLPPKPGFSRIYAQRRDERAGWWTMHGSPLELPSDADGTLRWPDVPDGRYRLFERKSNAASKAVDVTSAGQSAIPVLDLSRAGIVRGRVETSAPAAELGRATITIEAGDALQEERTVPHPVRLDGTFEIQIPGDQEVRLRANHPVLRPDPTLGSVKLTTPQDGIRLILVQGPTLAFRVPVGETDEHLRLVHVLFFQDQALKAPRFALRGLARGKERRVEIGGVTPGTWTLWINAPGLPPKVLSDVELSDGATDLGLVAFDPGSSIRVRLTGDVSQRTWIRAIAKAGPAFHRRVYAEGRNEAILKGLPPGRYEVLVSVDEDHPLGSPGEVGIRDVDVDVDVEEGRETVVDWRLP